MGIAQRYLWLVRLILITAVAYLIADMVNLAIISRLEAAIKLHGRFVDSPPHANGEKTPTKIGKRVDYRKIIEGNIFNSMLREGFLHAEKANLPLSEITPLPLPSHYLLIGTVIGNEATPYAVIEEVTNHVQLLYREGDLLDEETKILQISRNRVILKKREGEGREILEIAFPLEENQIETTGIQPTITRVPSPSHPGIRQTSKNGWVLDREEVNHAVANLPQLLTKARIIPNFRDGKPDGFRIFAIHEDSLYSKIGLENGDVLYRVNDIEVRDPQNFIRVLEQLKNESHLIVDLVRNNQRETFNYDVR